MGKTGKPMEPKKSAVSIWCKIYTNNFSEEMINRMATGQEIFDFLMEDSGSCFDDQGNKIPGDLNLWYLGCNEKYGGLVYKDNIWSWGFGGASFDYVEMFIYSAYLDGMFSNGQYETLICKVKEGRFIGDMYRIKDYLICRREGKPWKVNINKQKGETDICLLK